MNIGLFGIIRYALIPATAVFLGGAIAAFRAPGPQLRSAVQHFAAGLLFAAIATELLPDIVHQRAPFATVGGFALGVVLMLGIKQVLERAGQAEVSDAEQPVTLLITLAVDITIDGLLVGLAFAAGAAKGLLLALALSIEAFFLGMSGAVALSKAGEGRGKIIATAAGLAVLVALGAVVGASLLSGLTGLALDAVLSFAVAALLYLVVEELLVEAHEEPETPLLAAMFFMGFITLLVIEMLAG